MEILKFIDMGLTFGLEIVMILGYFVIGFAIDAPPVLDWAVAIALPVYAGLRWGIFVAPKAKHRLPQPWRILYELKLMMISAMALYVGGWTKVATVFMACIVIHISLSMMIHRKKVSGLAV